MVPYINMPYAEHFLKVVGADPNVKASEKDIDKLIEAARTCQELVRNMEKQDDIKGYLIYNEKPAQTEKK